MVNRNIHNPHFPQTCPSRQSSQCISATYTLTSSNASITLDSPRERERANYQLDNEREVQHHN